MDFRYFPLMMQQFLILLYKDYLLRKRHYIITFCELILPIVFACMPLLFLLIFNENPKSVVIDMNFDDYYNTVNDSDWPKLNKSKYNIVDPYNVVKGVDVTILYVPLNPVTANIMNETFARWMDKTKVSGNVIYKGYENVKQMESFIFIFSSKPMKIVCTVFHNIKKTLPSSLEYTIRAGDLEDIDTYHTDFVHKPRRASSPYLDTLFVGWQLELEKTFIQQRYREKYKNKKFEFSVSLREFPRRSQRFNTSVWHILSLWPFQFSVGFLIFGSILIYRITSEKSNGMQVLMTSMGLLRFTYWLSTFISYFLCGFFLSFIISLIYKIPFPDRMLVFVHTPFSTLFVMMLTFIVNLILFCFVLTIFFETPKYAVTFFVLIHIITYVELFFFYFFGSNLAAFIELRNSIKFYLNLVPLSTIFYSFQLIIFFEIKGSSFLWSDLTERRLLDNDSKFVIRGFFTSLIILILLLWYFDSVWPFQKGVKRPFYFPFMVRYWCALCSKSKRLLNEDLKMINEYDSELFEPDDANTCPSIVVQNLTVRYDSIFTSKSVIDNMNFNVNSGQITLLLGHKNTGKTTLFKVLSGLCEPTSGRIFINGLDLYSNLSRIKKYVGVCLQKCVFYEYLSIHEHLQIFAGIKGVPFTEINDQSLSMQNLLLVNTNRFVKELSLEKIRKMNLALAFIGNSEVLLLDDPDECMSSRARYHLWTVLLSMATNRTILISSSSVGSMCNSWNRIALLSFGKLLYCGSIRFLKKKLDVGYKVHLTKDALFQVDQVLEIIKNYYKMAYLEKETETIALINFHSDSNVMLGYLFDDLESVKRKIGVKSFGIIEVSMSDVFMNEPYITFLGKENSGLLVDHEDICIRGLRELQKYSKESWNICYCRLYGIFYKKFHYMFRFWGVWLIRMLIPFILMCFCLMFLQNYHIKQYTALYLNPYAVYGDISLGFVQNYSGASKWPISKVESIVQNALLTVMEENYVSVYLHDDLIDLLDLYSYTDYPTYTHGFIIGGSFNRSSETTEFVAWFNAEHYHTAPISVNLMHTAILRYLLGNGSICLKNDPLPFNYMATTEQDIAKEKIIILASIPLISSLIGASYILEPIYERTSKAKLFQLMSGLSLRLYWLATFIWDISIYHIMCFFLTLPVVFFETYYFQHPGSFRALYTLFIFFGWCTIPFAYLLSLAFSKPIYAGICLFLFYITTGYILVFALAFNIYAGVWILRIFPSYSITEGFYETFIIGLNNSICNAADKRVLDSFCNESSRTDSSPFFKCCSQVIDECGDHCEHNHDFIALELKHGITNVIIVMFLLGLFCFMFLALIEAAIYQSYKGRFPIKQVYGECYRKDNNIIAPGVFAEKERIENLFASGNHEENLMVLDLTKYYGRLCVVNNLTFGVRASECLCILGGHKAGKSALVKMLAGEIIPTAGNAFIKGNNLVTNLKKLQSDVGYCPQYDALLNHLTGREMLRFFSRISGFVEDDLETRLIEMVKIENQADDLIKHYSFINKRKLAVAMAIIGGPAVLIFDEPTTGLDFESKIILWTLLHTVKNYTENESAIIYSSSSILECQELCKIGLCNRLAIIQDGTFHCIGSFDELEMKYNTGRIVKMTLKLENLHASYSIFEVQCFFETNVPKATLIKYQEGTFTYHIEDSFLTLGALFHLMDYMKGKFNLFTYLINDSSFYKVCRAYTDGARKNYSF